MKAKIYLALTLICLTNIGTYAQSDDDDFRSKKNVASLSGVLSAYGSDPALGAE